MSKAIRFEQWLEQEGSYVAGSFCRAAPAPAAPTASPTKGKRGYSTPLPPAARKTPLVDVEAAAYRETYTRAWQREPASFQPEQSKPVKQPPAASPLPPTPAHSKGLPQVNLPTYSAEMFSADYEDVQAVVQAKGGRKATSFLAATGAALLLSATLIFGSSHFVASNLGAVSFSGGAAMATGQLMQEQLTGSQPPQPALPQQPPVGNGLAMRHPGSDAHDLRGLPSVSVATIERVLKDYSSPAQGKGQVLYDLGLKYGIDPAYPLAFFIHESSAGTKGMATITHSWGNIRCVTEYKCYKVNGGYALYDNYDQSIEHWYKLLTSSLYIGDGLVTPEQITTRYAPSGDSNDPNGYANVVNSLVAQWRAAEQ